MGNWEWSDVRCFLAVARSGSTTAAAKKLGMNQTTCSRRIAALENQLAVTLFERLPSGYVLTDQARRLLPAAEAMEQAALEFADGVAGIRREVEKVIKVTAVDAILDALVLPAVARLHGRCPDTRVEIDMSQRLLDIGAGEADVALRASKEAPTDPSLVARRLVTLQLCAYCSTDYAARGPVPASVEELASHPLIALDGPFTDWLRSRGLGGQIVQVAATMPAVVAAVRMNLGIALVPRIIAEFHPDLVQCFDLPDEAAGLWLIYPERLRSRPEIREFSRIIGEEVEALLQQRAARRAVERAPL